ncbi:hypothetical protein FRC17_009488 [Serendipita sp. 399]|nr:hypothetical protein FRC17_009488 [Serendipita sp. 399]
MASGNFNLISPLPASMLYTLTCVIIGEDETFSVDLDETQLVDHLKNTIKAKRSDVVAVTVPAAALQLYQTKISLFDGPNIREFIDDVQEQSKNLGSLKKLAGGGTLQRYFPQEEDRPKETIHVLVRLPEDERPRKRRRTKPRLSDKPNKISEQTDPRQHTVNVLYELVNKLHAVQVTGTPGSGKTTLLNLLHHAILERRPTARVFVINGWLKGDEASVEYRWLKRIDEWDGYRESDYYLIDEGQTSYWDQDLWKDFKDAFQNQSFADRPHVVLFCSYNEELRVLHGYIPLEFGDGKLALARRTQPPDSMQDRTPVGLLLDWDEYLGVLNRFEEKRFLLDDDLKKFIFDFTAGHVGAVKAMFRYMVKTAEPDMSTGRTVSLAEFQSRDLTSAKLSEHLSQDSTVARSLSRDPRWFPVMKRLLVDGPISHYDDQYKSLCADAHKFGLIEFMDQSYDFPSPLHRQIWSWLLTCSDQSNFSGDLFALIQAIVARFRLNKLSRSDRRVEPDERTPPEAQYLNEWYRSLHEIMMGNAVISPEYATAPGKRAGRVDFFIPSKKWGIEIIRDGSKLREHSDRFLTGAYSALVHSGDIVDYALLDFRHTVPTVPTPDIPKIFYVVFNEENDHAWIYNNVLTLRWYGHLAQNTLEK